MICHFSVETVFLSDQGYLLNVCRLVEKHHIYEADALQIGPGKHFSVDPAFSAGMVHISTKDNA
jgi:hypothetical protein